MYTTSILLTCFLWLVDNQKIWADNVEESKLLILGGNGLLGSATVQSLLSVKDVNYKITLLNRGHWYWDTESIIKPYVNHIKCTRGDGFRESCTQLYNETYDTIIDFSSYDPLDVEDILILLGGRFNRYIYISTDSVYEVSKVKDGGGYMKEEDAVRPDDEKMSTELNKRDNYGHKKLECEEVLHRYHEQLGYEYIFLRLPDVLGPRDNTLRFYKYFMYTKLHQIIGPVHVPQRNQNVPISFVYSLDVGDWVAALANPAVNNMSLFNNAYNLAFEETITLKGLLTYIGNWLGHDDETRFDESADAFVNYGFPSVTRGPIDISKAKDMLNWKPTHINVALNEICEFYESMQYSLEHKYILDRVLDKLDVRGDKYRDFIEIHHQKLKQEL